MDLGVLNSTKIYPRHLKRISYINVKKNAVENVVCKMTGISSRAQCVKLVHFTFCVQLIGYIDMLWS